MVFACLYEKKGARSLAAAMRNIDPNSHALASAGSSSIGLLPGLRLRVLRLRSGLPLFDFGFLLKPDAFGGVVISMRLYVFYVRLIEDCTSFAIITEGIMKMVV